MRPAFREWIEGLADAEASIPAKVVLARLGGEGDGLAKPAPQEHLPPDHGWRAQLWEVPSETRLGVTEVAEALGRSKSWIYKRTGPKSVDRMPHRRLDGELTFVAGELRAWIRDREEVLVAGPMEPPVRRAS